MADLIFGAPVAKKRENNIQKPCKLKLISVI